MDFYSTKEVNHLTHNKLLRDTRKNISVTLKTLGDVSATLPILELLFRQESGNDLNIIAKTLGYESVNDMLISNEFSDIVEAEFSKNALGAARQEHKKVLCFKAKSPEIMKRSIKPISFKQDNNESNREYQTQFYFMNPLLRECITQGKERLLCSIANLGGENNAVALFNLQRQYVLDYNVLLDKAELRRYFPKTHIKQVFDTYMYEEVDVSSDVNRTGLLYIKMKKPLAEILKTFRKMGSDKQKIEIDQAPKSEQGTKIKLNEKLVSFPPKPDCLYTTDEEFAQKLGHLSSWEEHDPKREESNLISPQSNNENVKHSAEIAHNFNIFNLSPPNNKKTYNDGLDILNSSTVGSSLSNKDWNAFNNMPSPRKFTDDLIKFKNEPTKRFVDDLISFSNDSEVNSHYSTTIPGAGKPSENLDYNSKTIDNITDLDNARPVGNVEELKKIFANSHNSRSPLSNEWSSTFNGTNFDDHRNKDKLRTKYTTKGNGIYTDEDSTSSEDELKEGNHRLYMEQQAKGKILVPMENMSERKTESDFTAVVQHNSMSNNVNPPSHTESYLKQIAKLQEENEARKMAYCLAQQQHYNSRDDDFVYFNSEKFARSDELYKTKISNVKNSYDLAAKEGSSRTESDSTKWENVSNISNIDESFTKNDFSIKNAINDNSVIRYLLMESIAPYSEEDQTYALAFNICTIVMNHNPSIYLNELESILYSLYGRRFVPGKQEFTESSWSDFIEKYCKNVGFIKAGEKTKLIWKALGNKKFAKLIGTVGRLWAKDINNC